MTYKVQYGFIKIPKTKNRANFQSITFKKSMLVLDFI